MNTELIPFTLTGDYTLALAPDAEQQRAALLEAASQIDTIDNPLQYAAAQAARDDLANARISVEKTRVAVKKPVLDKCAEIDAIAKTFVVKIVGEEARLKRVMDEYAAEQRRIERERVELARIEAQKAEDARLEAERKQREADEAERKAQEAMDMAESIAEASTAGEVADSARKMREDAEAATREQQSQQQAAQQKAAVALNTFVPSGAKEVLDYEVTDIRALLDACPACVDLTPRRKVILERIKGLAERGLPVEIPGIKVFQTTSTR